MAINRRFVTVGLVVGGGAVVAYSVYKYEKNKQAAQTAATESAAAASGYGYGSAYGYGTSAGAFGYGGVTYGYGASGGFPAGYYGYGVPSPPGGGVASPPVAATTNAQWDQAAIQQMTGDGWDAQTVAGALGAYLNGRELSAAQVNVVDAAIGIEGYPPVAASSGYPPAIKTGGTPGGGSGGGQGGKVHVPNVRGKRVETARDEVEHAGLKAAIIPANRPQGKEFIVTSQSPAAGRSVNKGSTVTLRAKVK